MKEVILLEVDNNVYCNPRTFDLVAKEVCNG